MTRATGLRQVHKLIQRGSAGFSVAELVIALAIALVLLAVSIPGFLKSWNTYRLSSEASQIANEVDILRFTAVRLNTSVSLYEIPRGNSFAFFVDANKNLALDPTESQLLLPSDMQLVQGGFPASATMGASYAVTTPFATGTAAAAGIAFGPRGTVVYPVGAAPAPYLIVIDYPKQPQYGFRAITVSAMGEIRVWSAPSAVGTWTPAS